MLQRDQSKDSGFGDQLMEMQQTSWAIDKIRMGSFNIDMCFSYGDDDGEILMSGNSNEDIERGENICYCSNQVG